jgi:nitrogen regulatory protein PII
MQAVKRLEIILDSLHLREVTRVLEARRVTGYTVVHGVTGQGDRGIRSGDELSGAFENSLLVTTCAADELAEIVAAIRPILQAHGGVCLVSDAHWVIH